MNKGLVPVLLGGLIFASVLQVASAAGEIYKVVNPDGSVTFTDQKPAPGAQPVELKPLSVVETDIQVPPAAVAGEEGSEAPPTSREMRRMYRDFGIRQPQPEETFWGTANTVTIAWGSSQAPLDGMQAVLFIDGDRQNVPPAGSVTVALDRGEHEVHAELRDSGNRRIVTSEKVTFFIKQHSVNFNRPRPSPSG